MKTKMIKKTAFMTTLLFIIFASAVIAGTSYTSTTKNTCDRKKCSLSIYSGTRFVYEDNIWKPLEEAKSLKGTDIVCTVNKEKETDPEVECLDYNLTSVKLRITGNKFGSIPVKTYEPAFNEETEDYEYTEDTGKRKDEFFLFKGFNKDITYPIQFKNIVHVGDTSTLVYLGMNDSGSEFGCDYTDAQAGKTGDNYGIHPFALWGLGHDTFSNPVYYGTYCKVNISTIPNISRIEDAQFFFHFYTETIESGEHINISSYHVFNNYTVDSVEWKSGNNNGGADAGEINYAERPMSGYYDTTPSDVRTFVDGTTNLWVNFSVKDMLQDEIDNANKDLSIAFLTSSFGLDSGTSDYIGADTEEQTSNRPYLAINYTNITTQSEPSIPTTITCDGESCNSTFAVRIHIQCSGSIDNESDTITYVIEKGNYTGYLQWTTLGNHTEGSYFNWDLSGEQLGETYEALRCTAVDIDGSGNYSASYTDNIALTVGSYATEDEGRSAIEAGANDILGSPTIYSDVVVYTVDQSNNHALGTYDKYVKYDGQRWAFNYLTGSDAYQNMDSVQDVLNFWENLNMTSIKVESSASSFINDTLN